MLFRSVTLRICDGVVAKLGIYDGDFRFGDVARVHILERVFSDSSMV